jgi:cytidylate kinase
MYRAITFLALNKKIIDNQQAVAELAEKTSLRLEFTDGLTRVFADNVEITDKIRSQEVNMKVSDISKIERVRKALVEKQRKMGSTAKGVVMEGRDISTVVFPDADVKIFLTASIEQRAERRAKEYKDKGLNIPVEEIKENINNRDITDSTRNISPLLKAEDAYIVDTSKVTIDEQVDIILEKVKETAARKGIKINF